MRPVIVAVVLAAARLASAQDTGPPAEKPAVADPASPRRHDISLSGRLDLHAVHREGTLEEARGNLNSAASPEPDDTFFSGWLSLRLDAEISDTIHGVLELETQPYSGGKVNGFATDAVDGLVEQAYIDVSRFLHDKLSLRLGIQKIQLKLRPHAEPFFLDVSRAESFYSGVVTGPAASFARATADRDLSEAAGARLLWEPEEFLLFQAFAGLTGEAGSVKEDEGLFYAYGNVWIPERASGHVLVALVSGAGGGSEVWTVGIGVDAYPWRPLEAFAEVYLQTGSLDSNTDKSAWALNLGGRLWRENLWIEAAFAWRTGDDDPTDGEDGAFQSYESVEQFLLVESAEVGLDWDTNVRSIRLAAGVERWDLGGAFTDVSVRIDVGLFRFNENVRSSTGTVLVSDSDDAIGNEVDLTVAWTYDERLTFRLRAAVLTGSDVLEALTASRDDSAAAVLLGAELRY